MLTKNVRTHIIVLRDWRKFDITTKQYEAIKEWRKDNTRNTPFELFDADTKEIMFDWEVWDIKEFQKRKTDPNIWKYRYVCDFWTRHALGTECECSKEFNCLWISFKDKLKELWYNIEYAVDITEEMRENFRRTHLNN